MGPAFEKMLLSEYQSNDTESCHVLFQNFPIKFKNLLRFNRLFLSVEMGDFLQKAPFENLQERMSMRSKFPFVSFLAIMKLACIDVLYPLGILKSFSRLFMSVEALSFPKDNSTC